MSLKVRKSEKQILVPQFFHKKTKEGLKLVKTKNVTVEETSLLEMGIDLVSKLRFSDLKLKTRRNQN